MTGDVRFIIDLIESGGLLAFLIYGLWGFVKAKPLWVSGSQWQELRKEKDEWKRAALRGTDLAEKTANAADDGLKVLQQAIDVVQTIRTKDTVDAQLDNIRHKPKKEKEKEKEES